MQRIPTEGLYEDFTPPALNIDSFPQVYTANSKQRNRLIARVHKVEEVNTVIRKTSTVRE